MSGRKRATWKSRNAPTDDDETEPRKTSWSGKRLRLIEKWPERMDLWEDYVSMRQANQQAGDPFARAAHAFLLEHRDEMHAGSVIANTSRFIADELPDGVRCHAMTCPPRWGGDLLHRLAREFFQTLANPRRIIFASTNRIPNRPRSGQLMLMAKAGWVLCRSSAAFVRSEVPWIFNQPQTINGTCQSS